jgi:DNA-binding MarR family transcriptional regulator
MSPNTERNSQLANVDQLLEAFFRYKNKVLDQQQKSETNCKLNPTKSHILGMILREKRCMAVDVARQLSLSSGATTIVLNQLESENLIQRERSEEDRRIVWLSLTEVSHGAKCQPRSYDLGAVTSAYGGGAAVNAGYAQKNRNEAAGKNEITRADVSLVHKKLIGYDI